MPSYTKEELVRAAKKALPVKFSTHEVGGYTDILASADLLSCGARSSRLLRRISHRIDEGHIREHLREEIATFLVEEILRRVDHA